MPMLLARDARWPPSRGLAIWGYYQASFINASFGGVQIGSNYVRSEPAYLAAHLDLRDQPARHRVHAGPVLSRGPRCARCVTSSRTPPSIPTAICRASRRTLARAPTRSARKPETSSTSTSGCSLIAGRYFDGRSSAPAQATLEFGADGQVRVHGLPEPLAAPFAEVTISDRVGNITRRIEFPDGAVFETNDNDAVDAALRRRGARTRAPAWCTGSKVAGRSRSPHWRASWWSSFAFLTLGRAGDRELGRATSCPPTMDRAIGSGTLDVLDRIAFEPSQLAAEATAASCRNDSPR